MFKPSVVILFLLVVIPGAFSQGGIDSINRLIKKGGHDTLVFNYYVEAAALLWGNEPKNARVYLDKALVLADKLNSRKREAEVYHMYAITYYFESNLDKSLELNFKALEIRKKLNDKRGMGRSYGNIGLVYELKSDIASSLKYQTASLHIEEELKNKKGIAQTLGNIGNLYMGMADYDKALSYQFKALKIIRDLNDPQELATNLGNISVIYESINKLDKAMKYAREGLAIQRELNNYFGQAFILNNIALLNLKMADSIKAREAVDEAIILLNKIGNKESLARSKSILADVLARCDSFARAEEELQHSLRLSTEIGNPAGMAFAHVSLGAISLDLKKYDRTIFHCQKAQLLLKDEAYLSSQVDIQKYLYRAYRAKGDYKNALLSQEKYYLLRDTLSRNQGVLEVEKLEMAQTFQQRAMRDSLRTMKQKAIDDARLAKSESSLKQQRIVRTSLIIGIIIVAGFLIFVFNRLRVIRNQKHEIEKEKKIREEQHQLLEEKNKEIVDSINYAWRIQHGMIPSTDKVSEIFPESFVLYLPKDKLSGDFYWAGKVMSELGELKIFAVADCTGHGIPGALVSITGINYLKLGESQPVVNSPAQALNFVNKGFYDLFEENATDNIRDGMDVALGALQTNNLMLHYASAKNPILVLRNKEIIELKGDKHPIGRFGPEVPTPFTDHHFQLQEGDMLYVFSDGYSDQFGGDGITSRKFKSAEFKKLLVEIHSLPVKQQYETLLKRITRWRGKNEQTDDITVLGIRI